VAAGTLPVRVVGVTQQSTVAVTYSKGALTMEHQGAGFPAASVSDTTAYGILVVDDSTQRAQGVLIYESRRPPEGYPSIGALTATDRTIPLYGVRVDWANVSNPKCRCSVPRRAPQARRSEPPRGRERDAPHRRGAGARRAE